MPSIILPRQLARFTNEQSKINNDASTLDVLLAELCKVYPSLAGALFGEYGTISPFIGIFVDGQMIDPDQTQTITLEKNSLVQLVTAVAGG